MRGAVWARSRPSRSTRSSPPGRRELRQGALIEPTAVAAYGVERAGVAPGDRVLVTGAGPIGALAALCARAAGASTVYVSEPNAARRARGEALGVATVLDPTSVDVPAFLHADTDGLGIDVAIECSGHPNGFNAAVASLRRRGTLAQTGLFVGQASVEPMLWSLNDLSIIGTWCYWVYDFDRIAAQIGAGGLPVERVITGRVDLDDAPDAFERLASGAADEIKVLVDSMRKETGMKALVFEEPRRAAVLELDVPSIAADEVLVRSRNVGICHSDFELYEGRYIIPVAYPIIPGHEWSGEVAEVGSAVTDAPNRRPGRRRVRRQQWRLTTSGSRSAVRTPSTSSRRRRGCTGSRTSCRSVQGAFVEPFSVAYSATVAAGGIDASDTVAVIGGGPIGLLCTLAAATMGGAVTLIEPQPHRRALGIEIGAREGA